MKQGGQSMNLENCIRFRRVLRQLGGKILIQPKRQVSGHKWLSSFTALSFTFFSAFPALPNQMPIVPEAQNEVQNIEGEKESLSLEELCHLRKSVQDIQSQAEAKQSKEEELCLEKKSKEELLLEMVGEQKAETSTLEATVKVVTEGFPIEIMAPSIAHYVTTWKCGASCAGHSKESVQGWISDVHQYYSKIALR